MKKIMKKALSLVLTLVLVLTLMPMTAKAATGDMGEEATLPNVNGETINVTFNDTYTMYYYKWDATGSGVLTLGFESAANACQVINATTGQTLLDSYDQTSYQAAIESGCSYVIGVLDQTGSLTSTFTATFEEGAVLAGSTPEAAIELTSTSTSVNIGAMSTVYYKYDGDNTAYTVNFAHPMGRMDFVVYTQHPMTGTYTYENAIAGTGTDVSFTSTDGEIIFGIADTSGWGVAANITITATGDAIAEDGGTGEGDGNDDTTPTTPANAYDNPEVLTELGTYNPETPTGTAYWYQWTAKEAGVLSISTTTTDGFVSVYTVNGGWEYEYETTNEGVSVQLAADDTVVFYVNPAGNTTANITASFEAGATLGETETDNDSNSGTGSENESGSGSENESGTGSENETVVNYEESATELTVGTKDYTVSNTYTYTVFTFAPTEVGEYTISSENSKLGIVSYNGMWITVGSSTTAVDPTTVTENSVVWNCSSVGQSVWVAVLADTNTATIKIEKTNENTSTEIPEYSVGYMTTPSAYKYTGDADALKRVNFIDDVVDKAVLGTDHLYHLNSATGPVLYVNLDDNILSLAAAASYGQLFEVWYYPDGDAMYIWDYNWLFDQYYACADKDTNLYPLTYDLIDLLQCVGNDKSHDWYNAENSVGIGSSKEDAWMFCCYYNEAITTEKSPVVIPTLEFNISDFADEGTTSISKAVMEIIIATNDMFPISITTPVGEKAVTFTFAPNTLELVDGVENYDFGVTLGNDFTNFTTPTVAKESLVLRIDYAYSGKLPATAEITIPVGEAYAGQTLYYYLINADGSLTYVDEGTVLADGTITVTQDHCSSYVLSTQAPTTANNAGAAGAAGATATAPKTGDSMNLGLWTSMMMLGLAGVVVVLRKRVF